MTLLIGHGTEMHFIKFEHVLSTGVFNRESVQMQTIGKLCFR